MTRIWLGFVQLVCALHDTLPTNPDGTRRLPVNEMGMPCPWPVDPWFLYGAPLGQYHCPYCGAMVLAGYRHLDYAKPPRRSFPGDDTICDPR